jgi:hypothetical protein
MIAAIMLALWIANFMVAVAGLCTYSNKILNEELLRVWTVTFIAGVSVTLLNWIIS